MINSFSDVKVLIVDDDSQNIKTIRNALCDLTFNADNIFPNKNDNDTFSEKISELATDKNSIRIFSDMKEIIKKDLTDIIFLDLQLTTANGGEKAGYTTGEAIIELFAHSEEPLLSSLPIVIISKYEKRDIKDGMPKIKPFFHLKKPKTSFDKDSFIDSIEENNIKDYLPIFIKNYRKIRDSQEYKDDVAFINRKLDSLNYHDKLENIKSTVENIKSATMDISERVQAIEIVTKSIAMALPKITDKSKAKELIEEWEKNDTFKEILGEKFPEKSKPLFDKFKSAVENITDKGIEDITAIVYEAGKEYLDEQAEIDKDEDTKIVKLLKYSSYFTEKVTDFVLRK